MLNNFVYFICPSSLKPSIQYFQHKNLRTNNSSFIATSHSLVHKHQSKMSSKKTECISQANLVATTRATWKIAGYCGPLQSVVRSRASCFVSMRVSPTETIDLRFYLRYVEKHDDPAYDTCSKEYKRQAKFSGYSLLADVLSDHTDELIISVSVKDAGGDKSSFDTKMNVLVLEPNSIKTGLTFIKVFRPCETWTEYSNKRVESYKLLDKNICDPNTSTSDGKFVLTVSSYKMENAGPDNPKNKQPEMVETSSASEPTQNHNVFQFEPEKCSDLVLISRDGVEIRTHQYILAAQSSYLFSLLKSGATSLSLDLDASPLLALLHYLYHGKFQENFERYIEEILEAAVKFGIFAFLKTLDNKLIQIANPKNMSRLVKFAVMYGMGKATENLAKLTERDSPVQDKPIQDTQENDEDTDTSKTGSSLTSTGARDQKQPNKNKNLEPVLASSLSLHESGVAQPSRLKNQSSLLLTKEADIIEMDKCESSLPNCVVVALE